MVMLISCDSKAFKVGTQIGQTDQRDQMHYDSRMLITARRQIVGQSSHKTSHCVTVHVVDVSTVVDI